MSSVFNILNVNLVALSFTNIQERILQYQIDHDFFAERKMLRRIE